MISNSKSQVFAVKTSEKSNKQSDSLFFKQKLTKKISNKESFYQYLLINSNFSNNLVASQLLKKRLELKKDVLLPDHSDNQSFLNTSLNSLLNVSSSKLPRSSEILENLKIPKNSSNNLENRLSVNSFFFQDQFFITYKKSFLCYWLLPLLGLAGTTSLTLTNSSSIPRTSIVFEINKKSPTQNNIYAPNTEVHDFSVLLSKSNLFKNQTSVSSSKLRLSDYGAQNIEKQLTSQKISQLLLNDLIRLRPELLTIQTPINFTTLNFALLKNKLKQQSNFKWYWFHLFLKNSPMRNNLIENKQQKNQVFFPTKLLTFQNKLDQLSEKDLISSKPIKNKISEINTLKTTSEKFNTSKKMFKVNTLLKNNYFLKNPFLLGVINKQKSDVIYKPALKETIGPYKSFKKMYFLMNKLNLLESNFFNSEYLWSSSLSNPALKNIELNKKYLSEHIPNQKLLFKHLNLKKTLVLIFSDSSKSFQSSVKRNLTEVDSDLLCQYIYEKLINNLDLILSGYSSELVQNKNSQSLLINPFKFVSKNVSYNLKSNFLIKSKSDLNPVSTIHSIRLEKEKSHLTLPKLTTSKIWTDPFISLEKKIFLNLFSRNIDELDLNIKKTNQSNFSVLTLSNSIRGGSVIIKTEKSSSERNFKVTNNKTTINESSNRNLVQFTNLNDNFFNKKVMVNKSVNIFNKNNFLNLSKYTNMLTNKIKISLSPYKFRLKYFPEMKIIKSKFNNKNYKKTFQSSRKFNLKKVEKPKVEKLFMSYLSRSKTPSQLKSANISNENRIKKNISESQNYNLIKLKDKSQLEFFKYSMIKKINSKENKEKNRISPLLMSKNRLFMHKVGLELKQKNSQNKSLIDKSFLNFEKNQSLKVKRRLKKMKSETRRRKKRKIFYPRPTWLTFNLYTRFLNSRFYGNKKLEQNSKQLLSTRAKGSRIFFPGQRLNNIKNYLNTNIVPSVQGASFDFNTRYGYSHWLSEKQLNPSKGSLKNTKDFYKISKSVSTNLRQVLMKSNWLRNYLNPYLSKVKIILKDIQTSSKRLQIYTTLRSFLLSLYGSNSSLVFESRRDRDFSKTVSLTEPFFLNTKNYISEAQNHYNFSGKSKTNKMLSNRLSTIDTLEYNRIIYQRLQRVVLNIRDNLNLNGQFKSRSKTLGRNIRPFLKRDYTKRDPNNGMPVNQNAILWSKVLKNNVLKFTRSFFNSSYEESSPYINSSDPFSRNQFYWALNKSSALINTNFNSSFSKKLWETYKIREISKKNQTKKIIFNMFIKYTSLFQPISSINKYNNVLNSTFVFKNQEDNGTIEETKFSRFFSKKIGLFDRSLNLNFLDDQISKNVFTLPSKIYLNKTEQKLIRIENKLKILGLYSKKIDYNYKTSYFRFLKNELLKENKFYYNSLDKFPSILERAMMFSQMKTVEKNLLFSENPLFKNDYYSLGSQTKLANNGSYWWSFFKINSNYEPKPIGKLSDPTGLALSSFLFHFCALISFISLGGIRTLIKFYFMVISKVSKAIGDLEKLSKILPKKSFSEKTISFIDESYDSIYSSKVMNDKWIEPSKRLKKRSNEKSELFSNLFLTKVPNSKNSTNIALKTLKLSFLKYLTARSKKSSFNFDLKNNKYNLEQVNNQKVIKNKDDLNLKKLKLYYFSFLKLSVLVRFGHKISFYSYLLLLKSVDILAIPASFIYKFFEKPGEYVVENLAYSFLVEWSADLISTVPETVDMVQAQYFLKLNRYNSLILLQNWLNPINGLKGEFKSFDSFFQTGILFMFTNSALKRLLNSSFLTFIQQLWEPDLDYIYRQKKAQSIWDIWGEHLKLIAEENSINIYELTTNKEDQVKLLSKYEESIKNNSFRNKTSNLTSFYSLNILKSPINSQKLKLQNNGIQQKFNNLFKLSTKKDIFNNRNENRWSLDLKDSNAHTFYNWSVSQFLSYQGKDTDLFIDLHPPQNFSSSTVSLKYAYSIQQPIGSIVCQIFSGIFYKEISKNILVIGSQGTEKSFLIQAIAGETELKIITDSAHRYAMVYRGVAVGIKLLKDVFEALSVHTPCIFLLEDIHAIGERRPFLIDESTPNESTYNKNKSMQALFSKDKSKEGVYKTSKHLLSHYKKPYKETRGLATNHFSFTFLFGDVSNKIRNNELKLSSSLALQVIKKENELTYKKSKSKVSFSSLLINHSTGENLAPPASSPFSVLLLKEATKLKHKKTVKEIPWFGLPGEQYSLVSKYNYSIRVKVALLADLVLSNLSVKLDMITDLLVIIDSVKSNRGFVVFATTHVPYLLDPALRRPGRFDETISLPIIPSLYSRLINYRSNFQYLNNSLFTKYSIPFNGSLTKGISFDLNQPNLFESSLTNTKLNNNQIIINQLVNYINLKKLGKKMVINDFNLFNSFQTNNNKLLAFYSTPFNSSGPNSMLAYSLALKNFKNKNQISENLMRETRAFESTKKILQLRSRHYSEVCKSIILVLLFKENSSLKSLLKEIDIILNNSSNYLTLFNSDKFLFKVILMSLMAGKIGESFATSKNSESFLFNFDKTWKYSSSLLFNFLQKRQSSVLNKNLSFFANQLLSVNNKYYLMEPPSPPISNILLPTKRYENYKRTFNQQYLSLSGENTFTGSISEKLQFHQKQRLLKRLYKYPIKEFFRSHLLKGDNISNFNNSYLILAPLEKTSLASVNKITSINWGYRNILYNRHKTYLVNQWWNGQQGEHNAETTFLSDIDWRYTFVPTIGDIQIDFPDVEQFYNPRNRRWINTKGDWSNWSNIQVELNDIYSHYISECFTKTYSYLNKNREIIDFYVEYLHQGPMDANAKERIIFTLYKQFLS